MALAPARGSADSNWRASRPQPQSGRSGGGTALLIYALVIVLVASRFFTERLDLLPRIVNAADYFFVPLLLPFCASYVLGARRGLFRGGPLLVGAGAFVILWLMSWALNAQEVHWLGALLFLYGLLMPIAFYLVLINVGLGRRWIQRLLRILGILLVINLGVGTWDAISALARGVQSHDFVFGTFGVNQNQLAFFLACLAAYLVARWRFVGLRWSQIGLLAYSLAIFLLCGFQTLWIILPAAAGLVLLLSRLHRRTILIVLTGLLVPGLVTAAIDFRRFDVVAVIANLPDLSETGKAQLLRNVPAVLASRPWGYWLGVGPGTFNSRAFRSIAIVPYRSAGATDVAAALVPPFYTSPLSARYIIPYFERGVFQLSGANTDGPFTSYVSVPVEAGLLGGSVLFGLYGYVLLGLVRALRRSPDAHERVLAGWALTCLLMLLGLALVDNYLETSRYTLLVWLAIAAWKVYQGQRRRSSGAARLAADHSSA
jgi:hypothetical protein